MDNTVTITKEQLIKNLEYTMDTCIKKLKLTPYKDHVPKEKRVYDRVLQSVKNYGKIDDNLVNHTAKNLRKMNAWIKLIDDNNKHWLRAMKTGS